MAAHESQTLLLTKLDDVCWLFNLRASDVAYNPLLYAYGVVRPHEALLFVHPDRLSDAQTAELARNGVQVRDYDAFLPFVESLASCPSRESDATTCSANEEICFAANDVSFAVFSKLESRNPDVSFK